MSEAQQKAGLLRGYCPSNKHQQPPALLSGCSWNCRFDQGFPGFRVAAGSFDLLQLVEPVLVVG